MIPHVGRISDEEEEATRTRRSFDPNDHPEGGLQNF
jgi:hypothetical protein